uniref:protein-tyrosine-phosphatase n=1 Tax=Macrostomum lignano TaxID=282301 RepID=A0A1I8HS95_9PLAT
MSFRFIGSYHVARTEAASRQEPANQVRCIVIFLDDTHTSFDVDRKCKGQALLDSVFEYLELLERDYFGLEFQDEPNSKRWVDPTKPLRKQLKHVPPPYNFHFGVKFYASDPSRLQEEYTRYHFFLQLKKDLLSGRLLCPYDTAVLLASYALQSELGDYNAEQHRDGYVGDFRFLPNQTPAFEKDVALLHQKHRSLTPACAELSFLHTARQLEHYGCFLFPVTDAEKTEMQVGVNASGVAVFRGPQRLHLYSWLSLLKISFKRKNFLLSVRDSTGATQTLTFSLASSRACKWLWQTCVEHHAFFRLHRPPAPQQSGAILGLVGGSKFRYSGRTEHQAAEELKRRPRLERSFTRTPSSRRTLQRPPGYQHHSRTASNGRLINDDGASTSDGGFLPSRSAYSYATMPRNRGGGASGGGGAAIALKSQPPPHQQHRPGFRSSARQLSTSVAAAAAPASAAVQPPSFSRQGSLMQQPQAALAQHRSSVSTAAGVSSSAGPASITFGRSAASSIAKEPPGLQDAGQHLSAINYAESLVTIRIKPDESGRFGFNVKGGYDQGLPILVSKVAPNMPADISIPRLHEGDQVLYINGRDMGTHTHEQAVHFIKAAAEKHSGELVLVVRPAIITGTDYINASFVNMEIPLPSGIVNRYIAAQGPLANTCADFWLMCWEQSVSLVAMLTASVERGRAKCHQYWPKLYECAEFAGLAVTCVSEQLAEDGAAAAPAVVAGSADDPAGICVREFILSRGGRERQLAGCTVYRCLVSRVYSCLLSGVYRCLVSGVYRCLVSGVYRCLLSGVYRCLVSRVYRCPVSGVYSGVYRFLVSGVYRCLVSGVYRCLVSGVYRCLVSGVYRCLVSGVYRCLVSGVYRCLVSGVYRCLVSGVYRCLVTQLQYSSWPDHGTPVSHAEFLAFVSKVRSLRSGHLEPMVVHCSAGIGRTGVLITMETALCLLEAGLPVCPLEIVRRMRDQRAMLIQTPSQFKFVCEAILHCYGQQQQQQQRDSSSEPPAAASG